MSKQEKKKVVITVRTVLKVVAIICVVVMIANDILMAARGTPVLEVLTDNPLSRVGFLMPAFMLLIIGDEKKDKDQENERPETEEQK